MSVPSDAEISYVEQLRLHARDRADEQVYWHIGTDGHEPGFTWGFIDRRSSQLAAALSARGVGFGDRVGLGLHNSPELVLSAFATWKLGAVPVPVRWDLPDWELARLVDVVAPSVYLSESDAAWIRATEAAEVPDLDPVVSPHLHGICSSGSTGTPKVILSAKRAAFTPSFTIPLAEMWAPVPRPQTILVLAPMYHVNAFFTFGPLLAGDRLVVLERFDAARALDVVERRRISTFTATPTMLQRMADAQDEAPRDLSSLVWINQGAAPMPPSLAHRWGNFIGYERLVMAYGMTEGLGITVVRGDEWLDHEGTVGRGWQGTEVRILGPDGKDLPPGEIGDIYLRMPQGGYEYLGDAPRLPSTDDGFVTGGDMGYLDSEGYLYLADRRVDLIITGGANVFPAEVETALIDHPDILDVVVIGLPDKEWGRRVHAVIEARDPGEPPTAEAVIAFAKGRLAPYKVPKTVEIVDALPRSAATKVNRGRMVQARGG
jgi:bile acid-coenzyme A ligase